MSTDTERVEESTATTLLDAWEEWYHVPVVGVAILFMFWTRVQNYERFITDDGDPALAGVDSWYHWRTFQWTTENYPNTMPYEVWTSFPTGRYVGQFGTLFDQIVVTVAMIVGLGDPSTETLYLTGLFVVPALAALVAIPVFLIGRRLGDAPGGIVAVAILALAPGSFFSRTTTGQFDHHGAEVLFMAIAILAMMVALRVAEQEKPIWELIEAGEFAALRRPAIYATLAGVALSLYVWVWPSAILLIGIFGVFFVVQLCLDYVRGVSPDHVAFVGAISLGVTAFATLLLVEQSGYGVTSFGYLQPVTALLVAVGCLFVAWLARAWNSRALERNYFPGAVAGLIVAFLAVLALVLPDLFDMFVSNVTQRIIPFGASESAAGTIQEASAPADFADHVYDEFGTAFYTMLAGLVLLVARPFLGRELRAEFTLILVWSVFLVSMGMTQIRFAYYLVLPVVVVNAVFVHEAIRLLDLDRALRSLRSVETYQVIAIVIVISLLFVPLLPPIQAATVLDRGENVGPHDEAMTWEEANHWMAGNTPAPGDWAGANNSSELDQYGVYEQPADGDFDYPGGAYGVMSWWDYGHLITVQGERIPHANPFQAGARSSSAYFQADSEELGEATLDVIATGENPSDYSEEEVLSMAEEADSDEEIRYVMIDHSMAGGKFGAITQWADPGHSAFVTENRYEYQIQNQTQNVSFLAANDRYYDTMLASLYLQDAAGLEHYRLVHENDDYAAVGGMSFGQGGIPQYSVTLDRLGADDTGWSQSLALTKARIDQARRNGELNQDLGFTLYDGYITSTVKTFERVEGATLTGSVDDQLVGDEDATVTASVDLQTSPGRTFTYTQETDVDENGDFELTVPYATAEELGPDDGYTNSSVRATGEYTVTATGGDTIYSGNQSVPETAVVDGEELAVSLEEVETDAANDEAGGADSGTDE